MPPKHSWVVDDGIHMAESNQSWRTAQARAPTNSAFGDNQPAVLQIHQEPSNDHRMGVNGMRQRGRRARAALRRPQQREHVNRKREPATLRHGLYVTPIVTLFKAARFCSAGFLDCLYHLAEARTCLLRNNAIADSNISWTGTEPCPSQLSGRLTMIPTCCVRWSGI